MKQRSWSVVERELTIRSYEDGDPLDDVFVVAPAARLHQVEAERDGARLIAKREGDTAISLQTQLATVQKSLAWAVNWIESVGEIPVEEEPEDREQWFAAHELVRPAQQEEGSMDR